MKTITRTAICALGLVLASTASAANPQDKPSESLGVDGAHLVVDHDIYKKLDGKIVRSKVGTNALIVTTKHWIDLSSVQDGSAFSLRNLDTGAGPIVLELKDVSGTALGVAGTNSQQKVYNWFLFVGGPGESLDVGQPYELVIHYDRIDTWKRNSKKDRVGVPTETTEAVPVSASPLKPGKRVLNSGAVEDDGTKPPEVYSPHKDRGGLRGFLDDLELEVTPQIGAGSDQVGLEYGLGYELRRRRFGSGTPSTLTVDLALEGRLTTDFDDLAIPGYAKGDINVRGMWLPGEERYYPIGARLAAGYESEGDGAGAGATVTGQVVASVPYVGELLAGWQDVLGFQRAFAPPFVSASYISSGADVGGDDQDRWEFEGGWILPVAETWDLDLRWRHMEFTDDGVDDEELFEMTLTYFPGGDLSQGVKLTIEEGYRPAVGDIGSALLLGYGVRL